MKAWWTRTEARVNALSQRERFMLFVVLVSVLGAATNLLFIAPLISLQKARVAQIDRGSAAAEEQLGRMQLDIVARRQAVAVDLNARMTTVKGEIDVVEHEMAELTRAASEAAALPAMLRRVMRRSDKVALVRVSAAADAAAPPANAMAAQANGLDITLAGGYLDLMEYIASLEAALPLARWSALRVSAETAPAQAAVRIVTPRAAP